MHSLCPKTAVLLFALPDSTEASRKPVAARQSATVWRAMRALTQAKIRASGLRLLNSRQLIEHRGTFGEQLTAALAAGFARGYDRIICVGNDCPDLSVADLRRAARALADNQSPVGGDRRGGLYLIGFSREQFDARTLARLPWQTERIADALRTYLASKSLTLTHLPLRADLNRRIDATIIRCFHRGGGRLLTLIRQAFAFVVLPAVSGLGSATSSSIRGSVSDRAPPVLR